MSAQLLLYETAIPVSSGRHARCSLEPVRGYGFARKVNSASDDGKAFNLCVDEAFPGVNFQGRGEAMFGEDGKPSQYTEGVLKFLQEYRSQFLRTKAFCKNLHEHALLEPMQAEFTLTSGEKMALRGFMAVSQTKLKALGGEALSAMVRTDELELLYLHLQSMRNFMSVKDRLMFIAGVKPQSAAGQQDSGALAESARTDGTNARRMRAN